MKFKVLASSSSGNCYLIENDKEAIVIECGVPFMEVKKAIDFDVNKIACVLLSHEHGDHAKYAREYIDSGIPVLMSRGTAEMIGADVERGIRSGYWYQHGRFNVAPFRTEHDCAEPFGFLIRHPDCGMFLFATDTQFVNFDFAEFRLNHIAIECNYEESRLDRAVEQGAIPEAVKNRIMKSHMSLETCKRFVKNNSSSSLDTVTLLHLSDGNSDERLFKEEITGVVRKETKVFVADNGLTVDLNIVPW